ncbi:dihydropteroate synthase [Saxibacter everestensis]|uniref:Dihydropteroate synthase n=1 Tax=Saxibacter everestensis TaxID=2909229 RepID=A0ABY8QNM5_9MICO|nr:dihydropteroate synthase [Brevibacteriaceae bacterium ZFBP1038]
MSLLRLGSRTITPARPAVMAVINRTPDSFYSGARTLDDNLAQDAVQMAIDEGADIIDIGGVRAGYGDAISAAEEILRVAGFVEWVRDSYPDVLISIDTWRSEVADAAASGGANLINDTWAGHDPLLIEVAAAHRIGIVCSHTGHLPPRTDPHRMRYGRSTRGVLDDVLVTLKESASRAIRAGIDPASILVDPTHDFGKNTRHGLLLLKHTEEIVALGYPVLMALSRKDFVGETLGLDKPEQRLEGSLAATAVAAWQGALVFRSHDVLATRQVLDMVASIKGDRQPSRSVRGLA